MQKDTTLINFAENDIFLLRTSVFIPKSDNKVKSVASVLHIGKMLTCNTASVKLRQGTHSVMN
jgi:hypothetical protein